MKPALLPHVPQPDPDADENFKTLMAGLPEAWATVPASEDGAETLLTFMHACYGSGYVAALKAALP